LKSACPETMELTLR